MKVPVTDDADHDCVSAFDVKRDDTARGAAQDWNKVRSLGFCQGFRVWGFVFVCRKRTDAHALCFAREGEDGQYVESAVVAANAYLAFC